MDEKRDRIVKCLEWFGHPMVVGHIHRHVRETETEPLDKTQRPLDVLVREGVVEQTMGALGALYALTDDLETVWTNPRLNGKSRVFAWAKQFPAGTRIEFESVSAALPDVPGEVVRAGLRSLRDDEYLDETYCLTETGLTAPLNMRRAPRLMPISLGGSPTPEIPDGLISPLIISALRVLRQQWGPLSSYTDAELLEELQRRTVARG